MNKHISNVFEITPEETTTTQCRWNHKKWFHKYILIFSKKQLQIYLIYLQETSKYILSNLQVFNFPHPHQVFLSHTHTHTHTHTHRHTHAQLSCVGINSCLNINRLNLSVVKTSDRVFHLLFHLCYFNWVSSSFTSFYKLFLHFFTCLAPVDAPVDIHV